MSEPHGGGFKLKTLDYVFHRVPMLVQAGSVKGLPISNGAGLLEFGDVDALVDGALGVLDDFDTLNALQTRCVLPRARPSSTGPIGAGASPRPSPPHARPNPDA